MSSRKLGGVKCPNCFIQNSLLLDDNIIKCEMCNKSWTYEQMDAIKKKRPELFPDYKKPTGTTKKTCVYCSEEQFYIDDYQNLRCISCNNLMFGNPQCPNCNGDMVIAGHDLFKCMNCSTTKFPIPKKDELPFIDKLCPACSFDDIGWALPLDGETMICKACLYLFTEAGQKACESCLQPIDSINTEIECGFCGSKGCMDCCEEVDENTFACDGCADEMAGKHMEEMRDEAEEERKRAFMDEYSRCVKGSGPKEAEDIYYMRGRNRTVPTPPIRHGKLPREVKERSRGKTGKNIPRIGILIRASVLEVMQLYTDECDIEIEGLATSRKLPKQDTPEHLDEIYEVDLMLPLFEQANSPGFTEIATEDVARWMAAQIEADSTSRQKAAVWFHANDQITEAAKVMGIPEDQLKMIIPRWIKRYGVPEKAPKVKELITNRVNVHWHSHVNMGTFWSGTDIGNAKDLAKQFGCNYAILFVMNKRRDLLAKFEDFTREFSDGNVQVKVVEDRPLRIKVMNDVRDKVFSTRDGYYVGKDSDKIERRDKKTTSYNATRELIFQREYQPDGDGTIIVSDATGTTSYNRTKQMLFSEEQMSGNQYPLANYVEPQVGSSADIEAKFGINGTTRFEVQNGNTQ